MNHHGSPPPGACGRFLVAVDRRLRLARSLRVASWGLLAPIGVALVLLLLGLGAPAAIAAAATALAALLVAAAALGRRDLARAAGAADRAAGLHDLLKTHLELRDSHSESPWSPLLERRAETAVAGLQPSEVAPVTAPRAALLVDALALLALVLVAFLFTSPRGAFFLSARGDGDPLRTASSAGDEDAAPDPMGQETAAAEEQPPREAPALPEATARGRVDTTMPLEEALGRAAEGALEESDGPLEDSTSSSDARSDDGRVAGASATLRDERRKGANPSERGRNENATGQGTDERVSGGESGAPSEGDDRDAGQGSEGEVSDQAAARAQPSAAARRARGSAAESPVQAGASASQSQQPGEDGDRSEPGDSGAPGAGVGTAPQRGTTPPLGEATNLEVTLEEVLLAAQRDEPAPERHSRPSRRADEIAIPSSAAPSRSAVETSPELERPALKVPYPLRDRALVREYFAPREDEPDDEPKPPDQTPSATSANQESS